MTTFNRRNLLTGGLAASSALVLSTAARAQGDDRRPSMHLNTEGYRRESLDTRPLPNPVLFWNDVSLQLVALDHSIDAADGRAIGPCASARALGLAHIVMADAVAAVYPADFEGFFVKTRLARVRYPDVFIGAAMAWMLEYIYDTPAHSQLIGSQRLRFLDFYEAPALRDWEAGLAFARNKAFTIHWDWGKIRPAIIAQPTPYVPGPRRHNTDPFNADQGFYGVGWGAFAPLDPNLGSVEELGPGEPPAESDDEYQRDLEEVRELGIFHPETPTKDQVRIGLFWAYDGPRLIGTPPRLYNQIARQIANADNMSIPEMARLLALCNLAMADGGIVCWEAKYRYKVWRPVMGVQNAADNPDPDWRPLGAPRTNPRQFALGRDTQTRPTAQSLLGGSSRTALPDASPTTLDYKEAAFTPNFPAYPSGHATFGAACFEMLKKIRAERPETRRDPDRLPPNEEYVSDELNGVSIDNFSNEPRPYVPLRYTSIDKMIEDNNKSRVYLGVHWNFDCERGAKSGELVASKIHENAYRRVRRESRDER